MKAKGMKWFTSLLIVALIVGLIPMGSIGVNVVNASQHDHLFAGGTGTENDPYLIRTMIQFNNIREVHQDNMHFRLMNDITLSDFSTTWRRISSEETSQLTLDGNGYTIIMDVFNASGIREPLFHTIGDSSVIKNLNLIFFNNYSNNTSEYAPLAVNNEGSIVNVHVENDLSMEFSQYESAEITGDFAGLVLNNKSTGSIEYSSANLNLNLNSNNVAGFVWNNEGSINHSFAVSSLNGYSQTVVGFVGQNSGIIESSYADVQSGVSVTTKAAGFVIDNVQGGTISTSFSSGYIGVSNILPFSGMNVGGFVATNAGTVTQSYALIELYIYTYQYGSSSGGYFGGFVASNSATGSIQEVYSHSAQFSITNKNSSENQIWKGRLYGENNGVIERAYYTKLEHEESAIEGTPLLYEDLSDANQFVDWDFDQLWEIRDNVPAFQQEIIALDINQQFIRLNVDSQYQFTASERGLYPPFIGGTSSINWSVDDSSITVADGLVTIGEGTAEGDYILRAELADDPSIFSEVTFTVVHPKVLDITVNSELTNLVLAGQGGEYTVAFNVMTEGGAGQGYTIEPQEDAYITVTRDESGLYDRVQIAQDAPEGTYTLEVVSVFDPTFVQVYQFEVVAPYREIVGLKQDGVLLTSQLLQHEVFGEQSYELAYINHGNITSTPIIEISSVGGGLVMPIQGVDFSDNRIVIAEELKETFAEDYSSIYLYASFAEEPSVITEFELMLSNASIYWENMNGVAPSVYQLAGNYHSTYHTFITKNVENLEEQLDFSVFSNHPGIIVHSPWSQWDNYRQGYYASFGVNIDGTVPEGDYTVTIALNGTGLKYKIPVYVRDEFIKSISLEKDKLFVPKNSYGNYDTTRIPLNIELADGITNYDFSQLQVSGYNYTLSGEPYYSVPSLSLVTDDQNQIYLEIQGNSNMYNLQLGAIFDVSGYINHFPDEPFNFQVLFGSIDRIDIEGIDENNSELYLFVGESIAINATVISQNNTVEGFPIPQDITWYLGTANRGAVLDENGVFTLNEAQAQSYYVHAVAKGGFRRNNITIRPATVQSVEPAAERIGIRAGEAADFEVKVRTNHANFYSTTEFTVESDHDAISYVDGQVIVDENVDPGSYEMTFTSTRDTTKKATITVQVGGPTDVEVQPEQIKLMPGGTAQLSAEFLGSGEFTQAGVWDTVSGLSVTKVADGQYQLSVAPSVQPGNYTITYSHEEFSSISTDVTVQVYNITGITGVENVYHLNQGQELTLNPSVVTVNGDDVEGIDEFSIISSNQAAVEVNDSGNIVIDPDAATGKYTLTITSDYKNSVARTIELYVTSIDSVTVSLPIDSEPAYQSGDTLQLSAEVEVTGQVSKEVIWSSSNDAMVSVDEDGLVTIKAGANTGNYTLTATSAIDARQLDSVTIEVGKVTGITVDKEVVYLRAGEETTLTASADVIGPLSTAVEWNSEDVDVSVNQQGDIAVAADAEPGTYYVTVTSAINEQVYKTVTVEVFEIEDIELSTIPSIYKGTSYELEYEVIVAGEHGDRIIDELVWSITDDEGDLVAGITVDEDNVIHVSSSVAAGKYELSAQSSVNSQVISTADLYITSIDSVQIVEPSKIVLQEEENITLIADVTKTGDVSSAVIWSVDGPSELVTINEQGVLTVLAGAEVGTYTVIATSSVDATQFATVPLEVAKVTSVDVDQDWVILQPGGSVTLSASAIVEGSLSSDVNWSSSDSDNINVTDGVVTIHPSAPAGNYAVWISSVANPNVKTEVVVQVFTITGINVSESELTLNQGRSAAFSTTVNGTNASGVAGINNVTFDYENSNVYVENGKIVVGEDVAAGTYTITVKAALNESITKDVTIHVTSINSVSINEVSQAVLQAGESITVTADVAVSGDVSDAIIWSVEGPSELVTINAQGELTVQDGAATGNYTVTATSAVDSRKSDSVVIEVAEVTGITVDQAKVALRAGEDVTVAGSATVVGNLSAAVEWSSLDEEVTVEGGIITVDPAALTGMYEVKVTSVANPDVSEIVTVQVYRIVGITLEQNEFTINQGKQAALSYTVESENGEDVEGVDLVTYHSENNDITVNENGEIVVDEDAATGTNFNILVQSVKDPSVSNHITVHITSIDEVTASISELNLYQGESGNVTVQVEATGDVSNKIAWTTSSSSIEVLETDEEGKFTIKAASNAPTGTYTVKVYSVVDERKFSEIKVKVSRRSTPNPDPTPIEPTEPEATVPTEPSGPNEPAPTAPVNSTEVLKTEIVDRDALVDRINEKISVSSSPQFTDMDGHWANGVVTKGAQLGITNGYEDGSFKPDASITRAEFVKMLANILPVQTPSEVKSFNDITSHWAKNEIELFASLGIINGYGNGNFAPNQTITREEMVIIVARLLNLTDVAKDTTKGQFADINDVSSYAQQVVVNAAQAGIINGKGDNTFAPKAQATRAEALTVIINMLSLDPQLAELLN